MEQNFAVKFQNEHFDSSLKNGLCASFTDQEFCDVTFAVGNHLYKAHKIVLSLSSLYLKNILLSSPTKYPIVVLSDVRPKILELLLQFMYCGSVEVSEVDMEEFISSGRNLRIVGLNNPNIIAPDANKTMEEPSSSLLYSPEHLESYEAKKNSERKRSLDTGSKKKSKKRRVSFKVEPDIIKEELEYRSIMEPEVRIQDDFSQIEDVEEISPKGSVPSLYRKSAGNIDNADIKFVRGTSGKLHLVCNDYTFHKNSMRRDRVYWLCAAYQSSLQCRARCLTIDGKVVSITGCHNHETDYKERLSISAENSGVPENNSLAEEVIVPWITSTMPGTSMQESSLSAESNLILNLNLVPKNVSKSKTHNNISKHDSTRKRLPAKSTTPAISSSLAANNPPAGRASPATNMSTKENDPSVENTSVQENPSTVDNSSFTENSADNAENVFPEEFLEQFMEEHLVEPN